MFIHRLLYRSEAALSGSTSEIDHQVSAIVESSRAANAAAGLTGALLLSSGVFVQALEGPPEALEATFERICGDLRHRRVRLLELAVAEERVFGGWSMGRVMPTLELARLYPGMGSGGSVRLDATTANAAIHLMRTMLVTGALPVEPPRTLRATIHSISP